MGDCSTKMRAVWLRAGFARHLNVRSVLEGPVMGWLRGGGAAPGRRPCLGWRAVRPRRRLEAECEPTMTPTERRVRRRVANLLRVLRQRNAELTTAPRAREQPRHFAAAGLARCRALLEGMYLLAAPRGRPDAVGVLLRSLVETWAISVFVLLKRRQAILELAPAAKVGLQRLIDAFDGPTPGAQKWLARFQSLAARSADSGLARSAKHAHNRIWKVESYVSTHPNLSSIVIPYIDQKAEPWTIIDRPEGWMPLEDMLVGGGLLTGMLASLVYEAFGYRKEPISQLLKGIHVGRVAATVPSA